MSDLPYQPVNDALSELSSNLTDLWLLIALTWSGDEHMIQNRHPLESVVASANKLSELSCLLERRDPMVRRIQYGLMPVINELEEAARGGEKPAGPVMNALQKATIDVEGLEFDLRVRWDRPQYVNFASQPLGKVRQFIIVALLDAGAVRGNKTVTRSVIKQVIPSNLGRDHDRSWKWLVKYGYIAASKGRGNGCTLTYTGVIRATSVRDAWRKRQ